MSDDLAFLPAVEIAALLRGREVSSRELVELQLERLGRHGGALNAVVTVDADAALRGADAADAALADGQRPAPLLGVPITVKDALATAGLRTTSGEPDRAEHVPDGDAVAVARLRRAGCVIVGKSNVPTGVTGQETANPIFGRTVNPWDPARTPGGSSGGAAAALAAGLTWLEAGSDMGGSIRQPAHCCGVFGHVPSHGLVPQRGHLPSVPLHDVDATQDLMEVGALARSPADLRVAMQAMAGPDVDRQPAWGLELPPAPDGDLRAFRVATWLDDPAAPVDGAVRAVLDRAVATLRDAGARLVAEAPAIDLDEAWRTAFALWVAVASSSLPDDEVATLEEQARALPADDDSLGARRLRAATMRHRDWVALDGERRAVARRFTSCFTHADVLLCPVIGVEAPEHDPEPDRLHEIDRRLERTIEVDGRARPYLDQLVWNTVTGMARLPSTVVPAGRTHRGLPVGMQVVGPFLGDLTTLRFAELAAEALGAPDRPPGFA